MNEEILVSVVDENGHCELIDDFGDHNLSHGKWMIDDTDVVNAYEFNETYKNLKNNMKEDKKFAKTVFGQQVYHTPENIIDKLIDYIEGDNILVLYNEEIVERLIERRKCSAENITFVTDSLYRMTRLYINGIHCKMIYIKHYTEIEKEIEGMNFDYVISNPPYDDNVDLKIASAVLPHCKKGVFVHPSTYLFIKNMLNENIKPYLDKVELFWGNNIFHIKIAVPCCISRWDKNKHDDMIEVIDNGYSKQNYKAKFENIHFHGDMNKFALEFFDSIIKFNETHKGSILDHNIDYDEMTDYNVKFSGQSGNCENESKEKVGIKSDFFTLIAKKDYLNKVDKSFRFSKDITNGHKGRYTLWAFDTEEERENFVTYCKTKIVRFILSFTKINKNVISGRPTRNIPWLDFKKHWNDKMLKEHFNISNELYDYIDHFIPDYYSDYKFDM